ncbi:MAG: small subunit ribosomal protein S5 [Parcubacteria group bacterium Gr01-1014_33]|nr:MAG: small subunit ribosomal protein S5 [Parcubacteria group bacterium Gr01-1014_33]
MAARPRERRAHSELSREKSEFDQRVLDIRRTARVVQGGRRFSFRAVVAVGNRTGKVGVGVGKGLDVTAAIEKAVHQAKKNVFTVRLDNRKTIPHEVSAKFSSARVILKPAGEGKGLVAGGPIRIIADLAGIKNLTSKILGRTPNKLNNAQAAMEALKRLKT